MIKMMGGISLPCCKSSECMNLIIKLDYEEEEKERKKQEAGYY